MTSITPAARILLDLIYRTETGRGAPDCYRVIFGHREKTLAAPVTSMTVDELLAAQKEWAKLWPSSAAGAPQIIRKTMLDLKKRLALSGSEIFSPELQDRMAMALLEKRGWAGFAKGTIGIVAFGNSLAREWASFPVLSAQRGQKRQVARGQSYYAGDGLNKALLKPEQVEAVLRVALEAAGKPADAREPEKAWKPLPAPEAPPAPAPESRKGHADEHLSTSKRFWTWLLTAIGAPVAAFAALDWRVQLAIVVVIVAFAAYAIQSMPAVRRKLGLG